MDFNYQFDEYSESFFAGKDYCFLGNGYLHVMVQLKNNFGANGNAILLNLISADEYRSRRFWLLSHHAFKEFPSCVAVRHGKRLFCADSRQIGTDSLEYALGFEDRVPTLTVSWDALHEICRDETPRISDAQIQDVALAPGNIGLTVAEKIHGNATAPLRISEQIWCPLTVPAVMREVHVRNVSRHAMSDLEVWNFLAPNKLFLPDGRYMSRERYAACGYWGGAPQYLGLVALAPNAAYVVAEYPHAIDMALAGRHPVKTPIVNPFMGAHLGAAVHIPLLAPGDEAVARFAIVHGRTEAAVSEVIGAIRLNARTLRPQTARLWGNPARVETGRVQLDELYCAAKAGVRASVSAAGKPGRMNSGILQYDTEWSRDTDFMAAAAVMNGQTDIARDILTYAIQNLNDEEGHCFCGAAWEGRDLDYQIDTNGIRLWALWLYAAFTGDTSIVLRHWPRIRSLISAFFNPVRWVEKAGMIASTRDCWERWGNCGLKPGFELQHQCWATIGLARAADLSRMAGDAALSARCGKRSKRIWESAISHPRYALVSGGHFIKRRMLDGEIQRTANAYRGARTGYLEPDSGELQPILYGLVDGRESLASATLSRMESLWNQDGLWDGGGYARYNISSDPDATSGPWPGVTLMVARAALATRQWKTFGRAMDWVQQHARPTGTLFEHYDYVARGRENRRWYRGGIIPWLAYAEPSMLFIHDLLGFRPTLEGAALQPHLPPDIKRCSARLLYRGHTLEVLITNHGPQCRSVQFEGVTGEGFDGQRAWIKPITGPARIIMELGEPRRS